MIIIARLARQKSSTGIYHLILRGINRQTIFEDDEDAIRFLEILGKYQEEEKYQLYAYCLMGNHVHLLLKEVEELGISMKRIGSSFVYWYNRKYDRSGHLFQGRYQSENVEDDRYFLTVLRYIHQNPIKAGIAEDISEYRWSSYQEYIGKPKLIEKNFVLKFFDNDLKEAMKDFKSFHKIEEEHLCLEIDEKRRWKDEEAIELIKDICLVKHCNELQHIDETKRKVYINQLYGEGLTIRQISRTTGLTRVMISKLIEKQIETE